jgi:hypothetical protein
MIFDYPSQRHKRRHGPKGYKAYYQYKDWLRDEFTFRCVFCLMRERWYPDGDASFSVDHIVPQSSGIGILDYNNLLYACLRCNSFKRDLLTIPNPCVHSFASHLQINRNGTVTPLTLEGNILVDVLQLNQMQRVQWRREMLELAMWLQEQPDESEANRLLKSKFGFPDDLPDLRKRKPPKNSRPNGAKVCYYALRERGQLPNTY